jgi:predicted Rossmann fold flavoprotein
MKKYDLIVVGGGPAGMIAAGRCSEAGMNVLLIEKMKRPGRKLGITGKGRCNLTNSAPLDDHIERILPDGRFLRSSYSNFFTTELIDFMKDIGIKTDVERGGRVFPSSGKATDIVHSMENWISRSGVKLLTETKVIRIISSEGMVSGVETILTTQGKERTRYIGDNIIIATGGLSYPATGSTGDGYRLAKECGHSITPTFPSLVPMETRFKHISTLNGLNLRNVRATVYINDKKWDDAFGEINFIDSCISGPIILSLSRGLVKKIIKENRVNISIDLKPALDEKKLEARLLRDIEKYGNSDIKNLLRKLLPGKLVRICSNKLSLNQNKPAVQLSSDERSKIVRWLKDFRMDISGYRPYSEAIITSGGVDVAQVNQKSLMSRTVKGLYFAGELLDLDGPTGGYNLQIAFSTGWSAADDIIKNRD